MEGGRASGTAGRRRHWSGRRKEGCEAQKKWRRALHGPPCVAGGSQSVQTKWKVLASALLSLLSGIKREMSQPGLSLHANLRPLQSARWCRNQGLHGKHESKNNNGNQSQTSGPQMKSEAVSKSIYGQGIPDIRVAMRCKIPPPSMSILFGSDYVTQMPSSFIYLSLLLLQLTLHSPFPSDGGIWRRAMQWKTSVG